MRKLLVAGLLLIAVTANAQVELQPGMKINASVKINGRVYAMNALSDSLNKPLIEISGNDIVIDFDGALLRGSNDKQFPNEFYGLAILVKGGKNITIKNLRAKGYKVALMARDVEGLTIENC